MGGKIMNKLNPARRTNDSEEGGFTRYRVLLPGLNTIENLKKSLLNFLNFLLTV